MKKNKKIIILLCAIFLIVAFSVVIFLMVRDKGGSGHTLKIKKVGDNLYDVTIGAHLPDNIFDAHGEVSNTSIKFSYPSAGFYGVGISVNNNDTQTGNKELISGIRTESTSEFERNAQSAYARLKINLLTNEKKIIDIKDFALDYKKDPNVSFYEKGYAQENGRFVKINNKKYFIYKITEDATAWNAFAISEKGIINASLVYTTSDTPYSLAIYKNNDELFLEILENISFD